MRLPDWASRLDAYVTANANLPFSYDAAVGLDCCTFTFGAIEAMTGLAIGRRFVGTYSTKRESLLAMKAYCGRPALALMIAKLMAENNFSRRPPMFSQRGDALLMPARGEGWFLGVLDLNGREVLSVGEHGVRRMPLSVRCRAWRID